MTDISKEQEELQKLSDLQAKLADDLVLRFKNNIKAFLEFMPEVAKNFEHYRPQKALHFFCTDNGIPNLDFPEENHRFFINAADPLKSCEQNIDYLLKALPLPGVTYDHERDPYGQIYFRYHNEARDCSIKLSDFHGQKSYTPFETKAIANCMVIGTGLGYNLGLLYSKAEIANMIAIEPDPDIFYASLHTFDWASLLAFIKEQDLGFKLIIGSKPQELFLELYNFYRRHGVFLSGQLWTYIGRDDELIRACALAVKKDFYRIHACLGFFDDHLFAVSHAITSVKKHRHFVRRDAQLPLNMRRYPLFVVGNGPSLDHDIPFLRRNQDKAVIIACGTALDTLYHAGVKPDFYAATERTPEISETLDAIPDQEFKDSLTLIAGDVIHPKTVSRFKRTAIFGKPDEPFYWMWQTHVEKEQRIKEIDLMNPLVGNLGIASIFGFGFNEAYLFGLDCGKKQQNAMHSSYSSIYGQAGVNGEYQTYDEDLLEGNFGGKVKSNYLMKLCASNMETAIQGHMYFKDEIFKIFNCSDGAKIEGTVPKHSEDIDFTTRPVINKQELSDYVEHSFTLEANMDDDKLASLEGKPFFSEVIAKIEEMLSKMPENRTAFVKRLMLISEYLSALSESHPTASLGYFLGGTVQTIFIDTLYVLYHCLDEHKACESADETVDSLRRFCKDAVILYNHLPDYILGEHYHFCNGKVGFDHGDSKAPDAPAYPHLFKTEFNDPLKKFIKRTD